MIGGTTKGTKLWEAEVRRFVDSIPGLKTPAPAPLPMRVNVVFQIPGEVLALDFDGVRTGRYSKAKKLLLVQLAVPREVPLEPQLLLKGRFIDALELAIEFARDRAISEDLPAIRGILNLLNSDELP